jgi:hypothetical protein
MHEQGGAKSNSTVGPDGLVILIVITRPRPARRGPLSRGVSD